MTTKTYTPVPRRLSMRQKAIMEFLEKHIKAHGLPPNIREIGEATGISSTSVVNYNLEALEEAGYIERIPHISRGLRIVRMPANRVIVSDTVLLIDLALPGERAGNLKILRETVQKLQAHIATLEGETP